MIWILAVSFVLMTGSMGNLWAAMIGMPVWIGGLTGITVGALLLYFEVEVD